MQRNVGRLMMAVVVVAVAGYGAAALAQSVPADASGADPLNLAVVIEVEGIGMLKDARLLRWGGTASAAETRVAFERNGLKAEVALAQVRKIEFLDETMTRFVRGSRLRLSLVGGKTAEVVYLEGLSERMKIKYMDDFTAAYQTVFLEIAGNEQDGAAASDGGEGEKGQAAAADSAVMVHRVKSIQISP
jgi:hypothetical protein